MRKPASPFSVRKLRVPLCAGGLVQLVALLLDVQERPVEAPAVPPESAQPAGEPRRQKGRPWNGKGVVRRSRALQRGVREEDVGLPGLLQVEEVRAPLRRLRVGRVDLRSC